MSSTTVRSLAFGLCFSAMHTGAFAGSSAEQRIACTPDVLRLCKSHIPNVTKIVACMQEKEADLSPACRAVFKPDEILQPKPVVKAEAGKRD